MSKFFCTKCGEITTNHIYRIQENDTKHVVGFCIYCGWVYLPFEDGLGFPEVHKSIRSKKISGTNRRRIVGSVNLPTA